MKLLIALPALNESSTIADVLTQLPRSIRGITAIHVLVVDDGSSDHTAEIAERTGATVVRHHRPLGLGNVFNTAVQHALESQADIMATIDADGQFDEAQLPSLLQPIVAGRADLVTGNRFGTGKRPPGMPRTRYWGNRFFSGLLNVLLGEHLQDVSCGFRAYSREALLNLNLLGAFTYTQESVFDLVHKRLRVLEVPISVRYEPNRRSRVAGNLVRYGVNALKIILRSARDFKPLRFFGAFAALVILAGAALDVWLGIFFLRTGGFTPYKFVGVTGTSLVVVGILILGFALLADMLDRLRVNQERLLYQQRRLLFDGDRGSSDATRERPADTRPPAASRSAQEAE